jgi:hypothetical protein
MPIAPTLEKNAIFAKPLLGSCIEPLIASKYHVYDVLFL